MVRLVGINPLRRSRRRQGADGQLSQTSSTDDLPKTVDVVVVGGGLAGLCAAISLAERRQRVLVCDKGWLGAEQTSHSMGWVANLGDEGARLQLSMESKRIWASYSQVHGVDTSYRRSGLSLVCYSESEFEAFELWRREASQVGPVDARPVDSKAMKDLLPGLNDNLAVGAWHQPSDGSVEPARVLQALSTIAQRLGVTVAEGCACRTLETTRGRVSGAVLERGDVSASAVLLAGGAWSRRFLKNLRVNAPLLHGYGSLFRTGPVAGALPGCGATNGFGWRRTADGCYSFGINEVIATLTLDSLRFLGPFLGTLRDSHGHMALDVDGDFLASFRERPHWSRGDMTPFEATRVLASTPDPVAERTIRAALMSSLPALADAKFVSSWGAVIDGTPDRAPYVSRVDQVPGLYVSTGFSAHGLAMAPAAGELVADLIVGRATAIDPKPYAIDRFDKHVRGPLMSRSLPPKEW